jgi:hypothetical protein
MKDMVCLKASLFIGQNCEKFVYQIIYPEVGTFIQNMFTVKQFFVAISLWFKSTYLLIFVTSQVTTKY